MVSQSEPNERVVARQLQESGIRGEAYIVVVAYGRERRTVPRNLSHMIDVEYERNSQDRRRRERDANWCLPPPTWT